MTHCCKSTGTTCSDFCVQIARGFPNCVSHLPHNTGICDGVYISHWSGIHQSNGDALVNPVTEHQQKLDWKLDLA